MGVMLLQVLGLVLKVCAFTCFMVIHALVGLPNGEGMPGLLYDENVIISVAPVTDPPSYGTGFQPPIITPPRSSGPVPQSTKGLIFSPRPSPLSKPPPNILVPPTTSIQHPVPVMPPVPPPEEPSHTEHVPAPSLLDAPVPSVPPSSSSSSEPRSAPPNSRPTTAPENNAPHSPIAPVSNASAPMSNLGSPPPSRYFLPEEPPSLPPDMSSPSSSPGNFPPADPILSEEPPSSPPAPSASNLPGHSNSAPPHPYSELAPAPYPLKKPRHSRDYKTAPAPLFHLIPPTSSTQAPSSGPMVDFWHYAPPPTTAGYSQSASPMLAPIPSSGNHHPPIFSSPPKSPPERAKVPFISPIMPPASVSTPKSRKMPPPSPLQELPPPPPHKACAPLTCTDPLTYGPPDSPCVCVLPIQVGLSLTVALYTFFPLVSELAKEIAAGVYMKQSQVRIMGANANAVNPQKTIVLIDLIPPGAKFDDTTAYLTFQRFWHKQVVISTSLFGDYDVIYVRYPGLPPSPPLPPSTIGIVGSNPYPGRDNNARTVQPLGVDVRRNQHNDGPKRGILASVIISIFIILVLLSAIAWVFLYKHRNRGYLSNPTPPTTIRSLAKSSAKAVSMIGSGPSSPSFSLSSSFAAYTASAKTFSLSDIERATDHFNETRTLGEGGFGMVYSGMLDDGTKVAMKILKRYDQQGGREFLAEVEMLSRLHHRNLVKLIGICVEDRTRCLVYELIPNGSVESHLHGIDKESAPLDWSARLKIALGAARALAYLHEDSCPRVIHRDFKASNILLEDDYTPKVSDFGLARSALEEENRHISTRVMGTFGYVAPEYAMTGHLLVKSDVYSYGVVLLELLTGKKPIDLSQPPGQENLVSWSRPLLTSREGLESIIDPSLGPNFPFDSIAKVAAIASMCVQPDVSHRPFMGEVVQALKLVYNECDETKEEDLSIDMEARKSTNSDRLPDLLLNQSPISDYNYRLDAQKDLSMSELLSSSAKPGRDDSESFRWNSSSGPLRTSSSSSASRLWRSMRRLSGGSVSEHRMFLRMRPGSH
ncbi:receptor-like serine/threonine-protein kinase ALE2 isoform X2 [Primulina eburnea]|uniref:receptor-like serine/threonine-protein kinase ALE2 isoform X2 n=1 Tax=Primulina eburnea TaxID=1245227 RepID=UPI003C6C3344